MRAGEREGGRGAECVGVVGKHQLCCCQVLGAGVLIFCVPPAQLLLPAMFTARTKIVKDRSDQEPTELEDDVAKALFELQEQVGDAT